jgi:hypothetical protein
MINERLFFDQGQIETGLKNFHQRLARVKARKTSGSICTANRCLTRQQKLGNSLISRLFEFDPQARQAPRPVRQLSVWHRPQAEGFPEQGGADSSSGAVAAKTLSFFSNWSEPQSGH